MNQQKLENHRAVILALHGKSDYTNGICSSTMPLADRPFLQHLVECLVERGIKAIDFLLYDHPETVEKTLGNGKRWGADFTFHLVRDDERPYARMKQIRFDSDEHVLLLNADQIRAEAWEAISDSDQDVLAYVWQAEDENQSEPEQSEPEFCGAWIRPGILSDLNLDASRAVFEQTLLEKGAPISVGEPLRCRTFEDLLISQCRVLKREFPELIRFLGDTGSENVWVGRNVYMKSGGSGFESPFFIGANSTLEGNQQIGPNVVILENSYIRGKCEIRDALVLENTLVGEGLTIDGCILDGHQLYNVKHKVLIDVDDDLLLGSTRFTFKPFRISRFVSQVASLTVLFVCSPILALFMIRHQLRHGSSFRVAAHTELPTGETTRVNTFGRIFFDLGSGKTDSNWIHFWYQFLPGLINVLRGDLRWVGVASPTVKEYQALPAEVRNMYEDSEAGLINESLVMYGPGNQSDEAQMANVFQAVSKPSFKDRIRLVVMYFVSVLFGPRARRSTGRAAPNFGLNKPLHQGPQP